MNKLWMLCPLIQAPIASCATAEELKQPIVILILTDDQGYGYIAEHENHTFHPQPQPSPTTVQASLC